MHLTRFDQAPAYEAPNHFDMRCLRLQGKEAGPSTQMWMGMSQLLPGGHTTLVPSAGPSFSATSRATMSVPLPAVKGTTSLIGCVPVSYTHLTLPTNREV